MLALRAEGHRQAPATATTRGTSVIVHQSVTEVFTEISASSWASAPQWDMAIRQ